MDYFFCYNNKVAEFIKSKNIKHITVAQDLMTKKIFTLFAITEELQTAMNEYKSQSK